MSIVLFDNNERQKLYPLNNTCAVAELRIGIFTSSERWALNMNEDIYLHTEEYLSTLYKPIPETTHLWIDASVLPENSLIDDILALKDREALFDNKGLIAGRAFFPNNSFSPLSALQSFKKKYGKEEVKRLEYPWHFFQYNNEALRQDFKYITSHKYQEPHPGTNNYINAENIFIEKGAAINFSIVNASKGPVYIGRDAVVMEGCMIQGPFALCEGATLKMGSQIYGATTLGPYCIGGGEIKNAVMQGFSNKAHYGYLGDAVIGRWCNLGAGTTNSNIKNTAGKVKMWVKSINNYLPVDIKCGVVIGDYTRTAINTTLNTGTIIGVCCNVFGNGAIPNYVQDFQWGTKEIVRYDFEKVLIDINNWQKMKGKQLSETECKMLKNVFELYS